MESASEIRTMSDFNRASDEETKFGAVTVPENVAPESRAKALA